MQSAATPSDSGTAAKAGAAGQASGELQVKVSPRPASRVALELAIPGSLSKASYEAAISKLSGSVKLPGFRKGKVPRPVLLQQIGSKRVLATALEDLVETSYRQALEIETLAALGSPELSEGLELVLERFQPGSELTITLELQAEVEPVVYDPARVDELIEQSRRQLATLVPVEGRSAEAGDVAEVSFSGVFGDSGEPIPGGSSDSFEVELEEGRMIPGFVDGVIGLAVGERKTIDCRFPDSYQQQELAGRQASFEVTLKELKSRELPALDDAFAQRASDQQTLAELRAQLEQQLQEEADRRSKAARHTALLAALVDQLEVELPETMVQREVVNLLEQTAAEIAQQGMDVKKLFTPDLVRSLMDTSRPEAEQRLRRSMALKALAIAEQIEVEREAIEAKVKEISRELNQQQQGQLDPQRLHLSVANDLLQDKLLSWLEANSTITEKLSSEAEASPAAAGEEAAAS
jgi:trigger factor